MIESLLFLDDVAVEAGPDTASTAAPSPAHAASHPPAAGVVLDGFDSMLDAAPPTAAAPSGPEAFDDAEAAAAVAATEAGIAHAGRAAWTAALATLEHSAAVRDALVASGAAGPAVAVRGWCDVATVRLAAGDRAGAREAFVRARLARGSAHDLPEGLGTALAELDAELAPGAPETPEAADEAPAGMPNVASSAGGLLWLDTAEDAVEDAAEVVEADTTAESSPVGRPAETGAAARIAAVDAAVALAHEGRSDAEAAGGWRGRLRRLLRR